MIRHLAILALLIACAAGWSADLGLGATPSSGSSDPTMGGDVSGTASAATVAKVNGVALGTMAATATKIVAGNGTTIASVTMSGDATINNGAVTVAKVNGTTLGTTAATAGTLLGGNGSTIASLTLGGDGTIDGSGTLTLGANAAHITSGLLALARGGTNLDLSASANGKLLIGNGSGKTDATLTALSGQTITNGAGSISIGPKSYIIALDTTQYDHTGDTAATTLKQVTIPAGVFTTNCCLEILTQWGDSGDSNNKAINIKTGATTWYTQTLTTGLSHRATTRIWGRGSASQMICPTNQVTDGNSSSAIATAAIDFSTSQTLDFTCQLTTTTTNHVSLEAVCVRLLVP